MTSIATAARCALLCLAVSSFGVRAADPSPDETELSPRLIKTGLYLISGGGGNTLMRMSASGLILVDGKSSGTYRALMSQVRKINKISDLPVRMLIVTDHHASHTGNDDRFIAAGVPVVAQQNVKRNLERSAPDAKIAVTFDAEYSIRMGGVEARLLHFGPAHTDGDTVVYFPNLKVVALGDLYPRGAPSVDYASGGSLANYGRVLAQVLELDFDVAVPSDGPPVGRADVAALKGRIDAIVERARGLITAGATKSDAVEAITTASTSWTIGKEAAGRLYEELLQAQ